MTSPSSASPSLTYLEYIYPSCVPLSIHLDETVWQPDPLWTGVAFIIAFLIAGIITGIIAPFCLRWWRKKQLQDEEEALLKEKGLPMHMRRAGAAGELTQASRNGDLPNESKGIANAADEKKKSSSLKNTSANNSENATSNDTEADGLAIALRQETGEAALLEVTNQDVKDIFKLEESLISDKIKAMIYLLRELLRKLVSESKLEEDSAKAIAKGSEGRLDVGVAALNEEERAEAEELKQDPNLVKDSFALQSELGKVHPKYSQKLNSLLLAEEDEIEAQLKNASASASLNGGANWTDAEVEESMMLLKRQLMNLEKKLGEEARRQTEVLDAKSARRRELAEMNRLKKKAFSDEQEQRSTAKREALAELMRSGQITEKQAAEVMSAYEESVKGLQQRTETELTRQEQQLSDKLLKRRADKMKRLEEQQQKARLEALKRLSVNLTYSASTGASGEPTKTVNAYLDFVQQQREEKEAAITGLDQMEAEEFGKKLDETALQAIESSDVSFRSILLKVPSMSEKDVEGILRLHQQEMEELQRNAAKNRKRANDKLQEKLAQQKKRRNDENQKIAEEQAVLTQQQQVTVKKVLETQVDLSEDACKRILMEHERNVETLANQMQMSQLQQQKQLEQKLEERKSKLAMKKKQEEATRLTNSESQRQKLQKEIAAEEERIRVDHTRAIDDLRKRLSDSTRLALLSQEDHLSNIIGKLQVGQVRRKSVLQKQDKLLAELQGQLADKIAKKSTSPSVADQLLQQHQNEVARLTEQLDTDKERQERMLQDRLERKKLLREQDIQQQMRTEAVKELEGQRARGASKAATVMFEMLLEQKHKKAMEDLESEIQADLRKQRDEMNEQFDIDLKKALDEQGKSFLANVAAVSELSTKEINEAVQNAAQSIKANDAVVKKLSKELKTEVTRAKSSYGSRKPLDDTGNKDTTALRRAKTELGSGSTEERPKSAKPKIRRGAFDDSFT